jgi:hypothetical protein
LVYFFVYYSAKAQFSDIKAFYDHALPGQGWGPPEQSGPSLFRSGDANWVQYRRGDYVIAVEQDERQPLAFDVVYKWAPK